MTENAAKLHNLVPTAYWKSDTVADLARTWLPSIEIVELPEDRWSVSLYSKDIEGNVGGCLFPTRAAAIRSEVAAAIRHARDLVAERRSGIETVFSISDEQFRTYVAWLRGIVAEEASRTKAKIETYERGCRRATDWIADRVVELGVAGMHPSADGYPKQLAAAWAKCVEFQEALRELRKPIAATDPDRFTANSTDIVFTDLLETDQEIDAAVARFSGPTLESVRRLSGRIVSIRTGVKNLIEDAEAGSRIYDPADPRYPPIAAAARPRLARLDEMLRQADCREYDLEKLEREAAAAQVQIDIPGVAA